MLTVYWLNKKELFSNIGYNQKMNKNFKGTPVNRIDRIHSKRHPYMIENVTNYYSSDSPIFCQSQLDTNLGK